MPVRLFDLRRQDLGHVGLVAMAEGVRLADLGDAAALPDGALRGDDEGVVAGVGRVVGRQDGGEVLDVVGCLRDEAAAGGHEGGVEGREAGVATEDAEDADALVRADRGALPVDGITRPRDGRGEADAVLRALHVVVHGLGDGDEIGARVVQDLRVAERVVAADGDEVVDAQAPRCSGARSGSGRSGPRPRASARRAPRPRCAGRAAFFILRGLVRELCSQVPPVRSMVRVVSRSRATR